MCIIELDLCVKSRYLLCLSHNNTTLFYIELKWEFSFWHSIDCIWFQYEYVRKCIVFGKSIDLKFGYFLDIVAGKLFSPFFFFFIIPIYRNLKKNSIVKRFIKSSFIVKVKLFANYNLNLWYCSYAAYGFININWRNRTKWRKKKKFLPHIPPQIYYFWVVI